MLSEDGEPEVEGKKIAFGFNNSIKDLWAAVRYYKYQENLINYSGKSLRINLLIT